MLFKFLKSPVEKVRPFLSGRSQCKMGTHDLQEFAVKCTQTLYARCSCALNSLSFALIHGQCDSV
jgi:hypothetical protein